MVKAIFPGSKPIVKSRTMTEDYLNCLKSKKYFTRNFYSKKHAGINKKINLDFGINIKKNNATRSLGM